MTRRSHIEIPGRPRRWISDRRTVLRGMAAMGLAGAARAAGLSQPETAIEPDLPIIDAHHHLRDFVGDPPPGRSRYRLLEFLTDIDESGHNITQTVFTECKTMYRSEGPVEMRPVGETEFVRSIAEASASGAYGTRRIATATVGYADLRLGHAVEPVLDAQFAASGWRLRGIRNSSAWDPFPVPGTMPADQKDLLHESRFREGFALLAPKNLSFDSWVFHPQLQDVTDLATAFPDTIIVLNHAGTPIGVGPYAGKTQEVFGVWRGAMIDLAKRPNVMVKLGGLGPFFAPSPQGSPPATASSLAEQWRPYILACIDIFGPARCMFESNFPPNASICSYGTLWNAFKQIVETFSATEKTALFSGVAKRVYRLA